MYISSTNARLSETTGTFGSKEVRSESSNRELLREELIVVSRDLDFELGILASQLRLLKKMQGLVPPSWDFS